MENKREIDGEFLDVLHAQLKHAERIFVRDVVDGVPGRYRFHPYAYVSNDPVHFVDPVESHWKAKVMVYYGEKRLKTTINSKNSRNSIN